MVRHSAVTARRHGTVLEVLPAPTGELMSREAMIAAMKIPSSSLGGSQGPVCCERDLLDRLSGLPLRSTFREDDDVVFLGGPTTLGRKDYPGV